MVFVRLFGFFAILFELRRRVIRFIRPCARLFGITLSLRPVTLVASVAISSYPFVYSDNCGLHRHLLPRHSTPAIVMKAFSAGPSDDSAWWCTLPRTTGIGNTGACHRPRDVSGLGKPGNVSPVGS